MRMVRASVSLGGVLVLALACGPDAEPGVEGSTASSSGPGSGSSDVGPEGSSASGPSASSSSSDGADVSTSRPDDGGYEEDDGGTGCTFTCPPAPPPTPPPGGGGGGGFFECDLQAQDCPQGEKCMPWANDGGSEWNASRCSPVADDPGLPGDACIVEGSPWSGIDSCDVGGVCWQVDVETNQGVCHPLCQGMFTCPEPLACMLFDAAEVPLCVQGCDPLAPDCPAGEACTFLGLDLVCQPIPAEVATLGQPCESELACEPGTLCAFDPAVSCGNGPGMGCCSQPCDVNDPAACTGPEVCTPWFPLRPPPELAYLGVCVMP